MEGNIIRMTGEEARIAFEAELATPEGKARWERLKNMRDEDIDLSDIPELTDEQLARAVRPGRGGARVGAGRKPSGRAPITLRLRPSLARKLRSAARREKLTVSDVAERWLASATS